MVILLASKIQKPVKFKEWISRENMITVQNDAEYSKVIFINAPTGYGKTTFLVQWTEDLGENIAWLTVDETDNNALRFFKYIVYSVYTTCKLIPESELQYRLATANRKELDEMWDFYKEVGKRLDKPIRLIIDDFHHITEPELLEMIQYFVINLPESLKVCFASRHHPPFTLAVWQSMFKVTEVKMQQLRFTMNDMNVYLKQQPHQQEVVWKELIEMEGWPVGVKQVLQKSETYCETKSDQHQQLAKSVLTNELWINFSKSTQQFLLATSILDIIDLDVCDALLETTESVVHLKDIEEKGFFIENILEIESQYRYHYLFSVALQQKLQENYSKEFVVALHKKAAGIYFQKGNIIQAINHAVKGEAYPLASTWMMNYGEEVIKNRQTLVFTAWCYEFEKANIPLPLDLQLLFAFALLAEYQLEEADRVTTQMTTENNRKEWNAFTERNASAPYDYFLIKSYITIIRMGGVAEVGQWLQKGFDLHVQKSSRLYSLPLQFNKKEPELSRTQLGTPKKLTVKDYESFSMEVYPCHTNKLSIIGYYHGIQAETLYVKGLLQEAEAEQVEALLLAHHFQDPGLLIPMYVLRSNLYLANGQTEKAHQTIRSAFLYAQDSYWEGFLHASQAFIYLKESCLEEAETALSQVQETYMESFRQHTFITLVHARLLLKKGQREAALKKVLRVKFEALEEGQIVTLIRAAIFESTCYARNEEWQEMSRSLQEAMIYSKEYGYSQLFVEEEDIEGMLKQYIKVRKQRSDMEWTHVPYYYVKRLLQQTKEMNITLERLTPREQEVYTLLVLGDNNYRIAKKLDLAEGSVRVYLTSIYDKLDVRSRTQAMLKAYK